MIWWWRCGFSNKIIVEWWVFDVEVKVRKKIKKVGFYYTFLSEFLNTLRWGNDEGGREGRQVSYTGEFFFYNNFSMCF